MNLGIYFGIFQSFSEFGGSFWILGSLDLFVDLGVLFGFLDCEFVILFTLNFNLTTIRGCSNIS